MGLKTAYLVNNLCLVSPELHNVLTGAAMLCALSCDDHQRALTTHQKSRTTTNIYFKCPPLKPLIGVLDKLHYSVKKMLTREAQS